MKKLLIICGPTATGKTSLGLNLAKKFNGQIISADSRQVYKGMDIGTGKDLPLKAKQKQDGHYLIENTKVWGYDLVNPNQDFSVAHFVNFAIPRLKAIWKTGDLPILVGGTGLYLKALTEPFETISIPTNPKLRLKLDQLPVDNLQQQLIKLNKEKFNSMNHSDQHNPRRLIRAIEITSTIQKRSTLKVPKTDQLWFGLKTDLKTIEKRIEKRVHQRIKAGAQKEVVNLIKTGYSWDLPAMSAMGYQQWQPYLNNKITLKKVTQTWTLAEKQYLRRQLTWFNKQPNINWFNLKDAKYQQQVARMVGDWYTNN